MTNDGIARLALDVATELDRAACAREADLSQCLTLADVLETSWREADPIAVDDLHAALTPRPETLVTMDDLAAAVAADAALLRRSAKGDAGSLRPAMERCLRIHLILLTRESERFGPFGLAA